MHIEKSEIEKNKKFKRIISLKKEKKKSQSYRRTKNDQRVKISVESSSSSMQTEVDSELSNIDKG